MRNLDGKVFLADYGGSRKIWLWSTPLMDLILVKSECKIGRLHIFFDLEVIIKGCPYLFSCHDSYNLKKKPFSFMKLKSPFSGFFLGWGQWI